MLPGFSLALLLWLAHPRPAQPAETAAIETAVRKLPVDEIEQRPWSEQMQFKMRLRSASMLSNDVALVEASSLRAGSMTFQLLVFHFVMKRDHDKGWFVVKSY